MLPLRFGSAWLAAGLGLLALGVYVAISSMPAVMSFKLSDKLMHAGAFMFFMVWFAGLFKPRFAPWLAAGLTSYGLLIEVLQSFTPTRQPEGLDLLADAVGVCLGWLLSAGGLRHWCVILEGWLTPSKTR